MYPQLEKLITEDESTYKPPNLPYNFFGGDTGVPFGADMKAANFLIPADTHFLNHGSFGACPKSVLAAQQAFRDESERQLVSYFVRSYPTYLAHLTREVSSFVGADGKDLVWVTNATDGVLAVVQSLDWKAGDSLVYTSLGYGPIIKWLKFFAAKMGLELIVAQVDIPVHLDKLYDALDKAIKPNTKLALVDHITSSTGLILDAKRISAICHAKNVPVCIDGAHAIGHLPINLKDINADFYVSNCHKWLYAPKGSAFLWIHPKHNGKIHPTVFGDGYGAGQLCEFAWPGTSDVTPWFSTVAALEFYRAVGGAKIRKHCHELAVWAGNELKTSWNTNFSLAGVDKLEVGMPEIGNLVSIRVPTKKVFATQAEATTYGFWLHDQLWDKYKVEVPITALTPTAVYARISGQIYTTKEDYFALRDAVLEICNE